MSAADPEYVFEEFRFSPARCVLTYRDKPVVLGSRAIGILAAMLERPREVISKDELLAAVWPEVHVHESNIKVHMSGLRRALRKVSGREDIVKTIPGRGYIFTPPVIRIEAGLHTIPVAPEPFPAAPEKPVFGRDGAVDSVRRSIEVNRATTIVGAGGVGKTTVAQAAVSAMKGAFPDGIYRADLSKVHDGNFVAAALASATGFAPIGTDVLQQLIVGLASRRVLIVLDSCEHVLNSTAAAVDRLLVGTCNLTVLATSREPLRCKDESVLRLEPLTVPDLETCLRLEDALAFPATQMLLARAFPDGEPSLADADGPTLARIAATLNGLPLAIELAGAVAANLGLSAVEAMLSRSIDSLRDLTGSGIPRHVSLGATLEWSYGLLSPKAAQVLRGVSVFRGEFSMSDAIDVVRCEALEAPDIVECLHGLCAKSLVHQHYNDGEIRYRLLDSTRAFVMNLLDVHGERTRVSTRHADHMLKRLTMADTESRPPQESYAALASWVHDIRAALAWTLESDDDALLGVRLAVAAMPFWIAQSLLIECRETADRALARLNAMPVPDLWSRARLLLAAAIARSYMPEDADLCQRTWETALEAARAADDAELLAHVLSGCARSEILAGRHTDAVRHINELSTLAELIEDGWARDESDLLIAMSEIYMARYWKALRRLEWLAERQARNLLSFRRDVQLIAPRLQLAVSFANALWLTGDPKRAGLVAETAVREAQETGHPLSHSHVLTMGAITIAYWNGDIEHASRNAAQLAGLVNRHGLAILQPVSRCLCALTAYAAGEPVDAEELILASNALTAMPASQARPVYLTMIADALAATGNISEATVPLGVAQARLETSQRESWLVPELLRVRAALMSRSGDREGAEELLLRSLALADETGAVGWSLRSVLSLARLWQEMGREREAASALSTVLDRVDDGVGTRDFDEAAKLLLQLSAT